MEGPLKVMVSAIVLTKNEERSLPGCLKSLTACEQVIVVDSASTDQTRRIAEDFGAEVVDFNWDGRYPKKKQWALENVDIRNDWVLYVDADERVTLDLMKEICALVRRRDNARVDGLDIPLRYTFLGRQLRHGHVIRKRALVRRAVARFPEVNDLAVSAMWEVEGHYQPVVQGLVESGINPLVHDDQDPLFDYFERHNRYSDWEAFLRGNPSTRSDVRAARSASGSLFDRIPGKPLIFFIYSYLYKRGFLDGRPGFHYALAQAFYYWQTAVKHYESQVRAQRHDRS